MGKEELMLKIKKLKANREQIYKDYWDNLKPFDTPDDVPFIPVCDTERYNNYYVPRLIQAGAIPKNELIIGETYIGNCRNADEAIWNGKQFEYQRYKFGVTYTEKINHFEDDNGYDLFVPIKKK